MDINNRILDLAGQQLTEDVPFLKKVLLAFNFVFSVIKVFMV